MRKRIKYTPSMIAEAIDDYLFEESEPEEQTEQDTESEESDDAQTEETDQSQSKEVTALSKCTACAQVLSQRAHGYHWNYVGPSFAELHAVFDKCYNELLGHIDELAERVRALDDYPPSSLKKMLELSTIDDEASESTDSGSMVKSLLDGYEQYRDCLVESLEVCKDDDATFDLLSGHLKQIEKTIWMLRSTK